MFPSRRCSSKNQHEGVLQLSLLNTTQKYFYGREGGVLEGERRTIPAIQTAQGRRNLLQRGAKTDRGVAFG